MIRKFNYLFCKLSNFLIKGRVSKETGAVSGGRGGITRYSGFIN